MKREEMTKAQFNRLLGDMDRYINHVKRFSRPKEPTARRILLLPWQLKGYRKHANVPEQVLNPTYQGYELVEVDDGA